MASSPITSWQIGEEKLETVAYFLFLASKITVDGDYSHKIKSTFSLKENYDKPRQCIKKQRYHFANKDPYSQSYGFLVVTYRRENLTIKKAKHQRIHIFEL